jgi:hypothetical protein
MATPATAFSAFSATTPSIAAAAAWRQRRDSNDYVNGGTGDDFIGGRKPTTPSSAAWADSIRGGTGDDILYGVPTQAHPFVAIGQRHHQGGDGRHLRLLRQQQQRQDAIKDSSDTDIRLADVVVRTTTASASQVGGWRRPDLVRRRR